jgi:hypothetical protein
VREGTSDPKRGTHCHDQDWLKWLANLNVEIGRREWHLLPRVLSIHLSKIISQPSSHKLRDTRVPLAVTHQNRGLL